MPVDAALNPVPDPSGAALRTGDSGAFDGDAFDALAFDVSLEALPASATLSDAPAPTAATLHPVN